MISIRHTGIYVNDIIRVSDFYKNVFNMTAICENQEDYNLLLDELYGFKNSKIITTKLITEYGKINCTGDMIELVKIIKGPESKKASSKIWDYGTAHIAISVDDLEYISKKITKHGGSMKTSIHQHVNLNKFAFAVDNEGNWLELIERI